MSANTIITSIVTGGSNNHTTTASEANTIRTDFGTAGVIGAITLNSGSGGTGSFCVNADASPDMGVTIKAGTAQFSVTPSSQDSQMLRATAAADYTTYTINANASGSTKYDWIYLSGSATNANTPSATADNVTSIVTSRSSSNTTDNGTPPTYGLLLAIVTVANAASSITNANITDKRYNASLGAQNGSLIVTQSGTGVDAKIQAAGIDSNVNLQIAAKGTGYVKLPTGYPIQVVNTVSSAVNTGTTVIPWDDTIPQNTEGDQYMTLSITPKSATSTLVIQIVASLATSGGAKMICGALFQDSTANALAATAVYMGAVSASIDLVLTHTMTSGTTSSTTFKFRAGAETAGTTTFNGAGGGRKFGGITASSMIIYEVSP